MKSSQSSQRASRLLALIALATASLIVPEPAEGADPFYEQQVRQGRRAYEIGDHENAARALRIGAFGLLDEPTALAEALVFLALSRAGLEDRRGFEREFERIAEIEKRFAAYGELAEPAAKAAFEEFVRRWIPEARLRLTPGFEALARQPLPEEQPTPKRPSARRKSLRKHIQQNPEDVQAMLQLAGLELAAGREDKALEETQRALAVEPANTEAHCLRIGISAAQDECGAALASLPLCPGAAATNTYDAFLLRCLVAAERWQDARGILEGMTAAERSADSSMTALEARVAEALASLGEPPLRSDVGQPASSQEAEPRAGGEAQPLDAITRVEMARIRHLVDAATRPEDLEEPTKLAFTLASQDPESRDLQLLAAEVAYRGGQWGEATDYFRRAGEPAEDEPLLLFYFAVSLFESGEPDSAAKALEAALPALTRTDFVDTYARRILGR